jgi:hypothetical protein
MNQSESLNIQKLIESKDYENNTDKIRTLKHSTQIRDSLQTMANLKSTFSKMREQEPEKFSQLCISKCGFLYNNYTNIYHKVYKDEVNLKLMDKFINVLEEIEQGSLDQHEGSVKVGSILKEIYIDSALKETENLDKKYESEKTDFVQPVNMSWSEFKSSKM